jgi:hypothetical protein
MFFGSKALIYPPLTVHIISGIRRDAVKCKVRSYFHLLRLVGSEESIFTEMGCTA